MVKRIILICLLPVLVLAALVQLLRYVWSTFTNPDMSWSIAVAIDASTNVAANGTWGQTISYRAARSRHQHKRWGCVLCWALDRIDSGHCDRALVSHKQNLK